jgi:hypothetical protein
VDYTQRLADAVAASLDAGERPLVLGGDCTILLGILLALARRGRYGLLFLDGHADFYQPAANVNGQAASSELAFATGRGPAALTRFDGHCPLVGDEQVVALGMRDGAETELYGSQPLPPALRAYELSTLRRLGVDRAASEAVDYLRRWPDGIHGLGPMVGFLSDWSDLSLLASSGEVLRATVVRRTNLRDQRGQNLKDLIRRFPFRLSAAGKIGGSRAAHDGIPGRFVGGARGCRAARPDAGGACALHRLGRP